MILLHMQNLQVNSNHVETTIQISSVDIDITLYHEKLMSHAKHLYDDTMSIVPFFDDQLCIAHLMRRNLFLE